MATHLKNTDIRLQLTKRQWKNDPILENVEVVYMSKLNPAVHFV